MALACWPGYSNIVILVACTNHDLYGQDTN
jgi:hypothetical protein